MRRSNPSRTAALVLALAMLTLQFGQSTAFAQPPTPTTVPFVPGQVWAYRFVVTGPSTAQAGSEVTYRVSYDLVNPANYGTAGFVFVYPLGGVNFVSSSVVGGPQGAMTTQTEHSIRWDFDQRMQSGAADVTLRIDPSAAGDLTFAIYIPGSGIQLPEGSVDSVTTHITSASSGSNTTTPTSTETLRSIVDALFSGDQSRIEGLLRFTMAACTQYPVGPGAPPQCQAGEAEGTPVEVFPVGFSCEGGYLRRRDLQGIVSLLSSAGPQVLGVFSNPPPTDSGTFFYGDYVVVATIGRAPAPANAGGIWIGNDGITGVHQGGCFETPGQFESFYGLQNRIDLTTAALPTTGTDGQDKTNSGRSIAYYAALLLSGTLLGGAGLAAIRWRTGTR